MDANKLQVLREIGYEIRPACGTCRHGDLDYETEFGTCKKFQYQHLKHTGTPRQLSVYAYGSCPSHERAEWLEGVVHGFKEFLK